MKKILFRSLVVPLTLMMSPALMAEVIDSAASGFTAKVNRSPCRSWSTIGALRIAACGSVFR